MSEDQMQENDEPSRRTFLKVSAVAGVAVAAVAAGAGMIPKLASSAAKSSAVVAKPEAKAASMASKEPLILVLNGDSLDVYRGENKFPIQDSALSREIASRVASRME
jgi:TAT (twin-arginine translocation) pathway signal sequence